MLMVLAGCELGLRPNLFAEHDNLKSSENKKNLDSGKASLEAIGSRQIVEWFIHSNWDVRKVAAESLSQMTPQHAVASGKAKLQWFDCEARRKLKAHKQDPRITTGDPRKKMESAGCSCSRRWMVILNCL